MASTKDIPDTIANSQIDQLRKALRYWRNLELDYELLQDEMRQLGSTAGKAECLKLIEDFAPHEADKAEILQVIEPREDQFRTPSQIIHILKQRSDYVTRNISALQTQISRLKQDRALPESDEDDDPDLLNQEDLPHLDIIEQLDDEDNVIEAKVLPQSEAAAATLEVLNQTDAAQKEDSESSAKEMPTRSKGDGVQKSPRRTSVSSEESEETEEDDEVIDEESQAQPLNPDDTEEEAELRQEMLRYGLGEVGNIVAELELTDDRNMTEVDGNIQEDHLDWDDDEDEDFSSDQTSEEEDEVGQTRRVIHTEQYRQRMERLQEKLGMRLENMGPSPDMAAGIREQVEHPPASEVQKYINNLPPGLREKMGQQRPDPREAARKAAIAREESSRLGPDDADKGTADTRKSGKKIKKKVAFAKNLDIAPETKTTKPPPTTLPVVERTTTSSAPQTSLPPQKKKSRFKLAQETTHDPLLPPPMDHTPTSNHKATPTGPPNKIISDTLVEHAETSQNAQAPGPSDADDFDVDLQQKQIAIEHHRLQNRMIHENGGYVNGGESENWGAEHAFPDLTDPVTGQVKKVSRFKAARMRP